MYIKIHAEEEDGGVLVFLPGQDDIESLQGMLEDQLPLVKKTKTLSAHAEVGTITAVNSLLAIKSSDQEELGIDGSSRAVTDVVTTFDTEQVASICQDSTQSNINHKAPSSISGGIDTEFTKIVSTGAPYVIYPLYAGMTPDDQMSAFKMPLKGTRKFILATNIAETSVTIAGIKYGMFQE